MQAFPEPVPAGKRGRKPTNGKRHPALQTLVNDETPPWQETPVRWEGGEHKQVRLLSEGGLWDTPGERPVAIRWVVVGDPAGQLRPAAFFSTELELVPVEMVAWCVLRWNVEVTFEEGRRHLGVETPRQWSALAIARRTPAFFGLFSLVCVMASRLSTVNALQGQATAWYLKEAVTFSDVLAYVRRALWAEKYFNQSTSQDERVLLSAHDWGVLLDQLASAA